MPYTVTVRDDRLNPERAAPAAARYLARLETKFGGRDWAIFAYHCGEGCVSDLLPLTEAAVHHKQPTVAEMFFAANPAHHAELYQALATRDAARLFAHLLVPHQARRAVAAAVSQDPAAFRELAEEYQNPIHPQRRAVDRLMIWLKSHDIFYRSPDDLRSAAGNGLAKVFDDPAILRLLAAGNGRRPRSRPLLAGLAGRASELCCTWRLKRGGCLTN